MSVGEITVEHSWMQIDRLTATMRVAAQSENWSHVLELSNVRHLQLLQHFEKFPVGPDNAVFYRDQLMTMLDGEKELQLLTINARREVIRASTKSNQNHRAVGAYLDSARH